MSDKLNQLESISSVEPAGNPEQKEGGSKILSFLAKKKGLIAAVLLASGIMLGCDKAACNCAGCEVASCGVDNDGNANLSGCSGCGN